MIKNKIYYWASDTRDNSGEGILANLYLKNIKKIYPNYIFVNINKNKNNYDTFFSNYILNILGIIKLWKFFLKKNKVMYINYLPIWNFLIFLLLPPKTILGPITGSTLYQKKNFLNYLKRDLLFNVLKQISLHIIFFRHKEIYFATELLKASIPKKNLYKCNFNYVFKLITKKKTRNNKKKKIDFLIYNRNHENKGKDFILYFLENINKKKFKIVIIGDSINLKGLINLGYVKRSTVKKLLKKTKYTFGSTENLYTIYILDAISQDVFFFYDKNLRKFNKALKYKKKYEIDFDNKLKSYKKVMSYIKNTNNYYGMINA